MAVVHGVLPDHVHKYFPERDRAAVIAVTVRDHVGVADRAMAAASRPEHFSSSVSRWARR